MTTQTVAEVRKVESRVAQMRREMAEARKQRLLAEVHDRRRWTVQSSR